MRPVQTPGENREVPGSTNTTQLAISRVTGKATAGTVGQQRSQGQVTCHPTVLMVDTTDTTLRDLGPCRLQPPPHHISMTKGQHSGDEGLPPPPAPCSMHSTHTCTCDQHSDPEDPGAWRKGQRCRGVGNAGLQRVQQAVWENRAPCRIPGNGQSQGRHIFSASGQTDPLST